MGVLRLLGGWDARGRGGEVGLKRVSSGVNLRRGEGGYYEGPLYARSHDTSQIEPIGGNQLEISKTEEATMEMMISYLKGEPVKPGGCFKVDHSGSRPTFIADRKGMIQVGVALLRYAAFARREQGSPEFRPQSLENSFSASSRAKQLILMLDEQIESAR
jgi:hypothetical protein